MDASIGQEQQDLVLICIHCRLNILHELGEQGTKKSRTSQSNLGQCLSVGLNDCLDSTNVRISWIAIHRKAVIHRVQTQVTWNSTKSEHRKTPVSIIWLDYRSHVI